MGEVCRVVIHVILINTSDLVPAVLNYHLISLHLTGSNSYI